MSTGLLGWKTEETLFDGRYGWRIHPCPKRLNQLWGPTSLLVNGYSRLFPKEESHWGAKLTTHLLLVPRLRMSGAIPQVLHTLHGVTVFQVLLSSNIASHRNTVRSGSYLYIHIRFGATCSLDLHSTEMRMKKVPSKRRQLPALSRQLDAFFIRASILPFTKQMHSFFFHRYLCLVQFITSL